MPRFVVATAFSSFHCLQATWQPRQSIHLVASKRIAFSRWEYLKDDPVRQRNFNHKIWGDEVLCLPSEQVAVQIALRTQQIIAEETGMANTLDPLSGFKLYYHVLDQVPILWRGLSSVLFDIFWILSYQLFLFIESIECCSRSILFTSVPTNIPKPKANMIKTSILLIGSGY